MVYSIFASNSNKLVVSVVLLALLFSLVFPLFCIDSVRATNFDLVFSDNFEDGSADGWTEYLGTWNVVDQQYFVSVGLVENGITAVDSVNLTDYIIETTMRFSNASVGFKAGILFRYTDDEHYYNYVLSNEYDNIVLDEYSPGHSDYGVAISDVGEGVRVIQENVDYALKLVVKGNSFSCFLNGEEVLSGQDDSYSSGKIGLWARRADVYFDDFKVYIEQPITEDSLVGNWKFDESSGNTAYDSSSFNNDGFLNNGPSRVKGIVGNALSFDGVNDFVDCGLLSNFGSVYLAGTTSYTFWVRTSQIVPSGFLGISNSPDFTTTVVIHFNTPEQDKIRFYLRDDNNQRLSADLADPIDFTNNGWHHFAIISNAPNNQVKFYIDGVSRSITYNYAESPSDFSDFNHPLYIGAFDWGGTIDYQSPPIQPPIVTFDGEIDEVKIYNYELNAQQIQNEYSSGVDDPVGYWSFDEGSGSSTSDSSGNGNDGSLVNGPVWTDGVSGSGLGFDGVDDYVMVPDSPTLRLGQFSLCAWIYMETRPYAHSGSNHVAVVNKLDYLFGPAYGYKLDFEYPKQDDDDLVITIGDSTAQRFPVKYNSINDLTLNRWHFLAGTFDGSIFKIFIDGDLKAASDPVSYSIENNDAPLGIGQEVTGASGHFKGKIDEVRIYNRPLTENEIIELANMYLSQLVIQSSPVSGISFDIQGVTRNTPYNAQLEHGSYSVTMPQTQSVNGVKYYFQGWSDGNQNRVRTINFDQDLTLTAEFNAEPVAEFTYSPHDPMVGDSISFDASNSHDVGGNIESFSWDFGDGTTITGSSPTVNHLFEEQGTFDVKLTVEDNEGLTSEFSYSILVKMSTDVSISTSCSSNLLGFQVGVNGSLVDFNEHGIDGESIVLSYTFLGINDWIPITSDQTDSLGEYSVTWIPPATGYFIVKVEWSGNSTHIGASNTASISSLSFNEQYVFSVESNSTISSLSFNSTDKTLSFNAEGENGTQGYVKITVPKNLVDSLNDLEVYLDGNKVNFSLLSTDDALYLLINFEHSSHQIVVDLDITEIPEFPSWIILPLFLTTTIIAIIIRKKSQKNVT